MRNLSLYFNKTYYEYLDKELDTENVKKVIDFENKCLFDTKFIHSKDYCACKIKDVKQIVMQTKYPGMMIGIGNPHGAGDNLKCDGDIEVGFSFDYVSGQPYIPGSTVKGVIRSYFKEYNVIKSIIQSVTGKDINKDQLSSFENNIFEGNDVFFDAVLYDGDENHKILGSEYITPHEYPLKNPIPIHMLKILPKVKFEFRFLVKSFEDSDIFISEDKKIEIFKNVLKYFGIGAKTNVGYGILEVCDNLFKNCDRRSELSVLRYEQILSSTHNNRCNKLNNNRNTHNNSQNTRSRNDGGNFR